MAQPITFRNVANTVTGSAASALSAANSAFGTAAAGAQVLYKSATERDALANEELTNQTMRSIFSDGKATPEELAAVPDGADFASIFGASQESRQTEAGLLESTANVAQSEALTNFNAERTRVSALENTPEAIALETKQKQEKLNLEKARVETQQAELGFRKQEYAAEIASTAGRAGANELWNSEGIKAKEEVVSEEQSVISEWQSLNPNASEEELKAFTSNVQDGREARIQVRQAKLLPEVERQVLAKYPLLTPADLDQTTIGRLKSDAREISVAEGKELAKIQAARQGFASNAARGGGKYLVGGPGNWRIANTQEEADANELSAGNAVAEAASSSGLSTEDIDVTKAKQVLSAVNGNKAAFQAVFTDKSVVNDDGVFAVANKIQWDAALRVGNGYGSTLKDKAVALSTKTSTPGADTLSFDQIRKRIRSGQSGTSPESDESGETSSKATDSVDTVIQALQSDDVPAQKEAAKSVKTQVDAINESLKSISPSISSQNAGLIGQVAKELSKVSASKIGQQGIPTGGSRAVAPGSQIRVNTLENRLSALDNAQKLVDELLAMDSELEQKNTAQRKAKEAGDLLSSILGDK